MVVEKTVKNGSRSITPIMIRGGVCEISCSFRNFEIRIHDKESRLFFVCKTTNQYLIKKLIVEVVNEIVIHGTLEQDDDERFYINIIDYKAIKK